MDKISELLKGACDIHVHPGPSLVPRILEDVDAFRACTDAGITGIVLKDQYFITTHQAYLINKHLSGNSSAKAYGAVVLNNTVGGLSPHAVDAGIKSGAKIIWMPTVSAEFHIERARERAKKGLQYKGVPLPTQPLYPAVPLKLTDVRGKLLNEVTEILKLVAEADIAIGSGHVTFTETRLMVAEAERLGVKKIVVDHPNILGYSDRNIMEMAGTSAFIELTAAVAVHDEGGMEELVRLIKMVTPEKIVLVSDLGLPGYPLPVPGLRDMTGRLLEAGIGDGDIDTMLRKNPRRLMNLS